MVEVPRRPTMQEIQARRRSSITEDRLCKRMGMSLPNLETVQSISFQRNTLLTRIFMSESGETGGEVGPQKLHTKQLARINLYLFLTPQALRTTLKPVKIFKLPDFPASMSMHSVQNYYSELIQQLGKTIFSIQNENPALLARYSVFFLPSASFLILSICCSWLQIWV